MDGENLVDFDNSYIINCKKDNSDGNNLNRWKSTENVAPHK